MTTNTNIYGIRFSFFITQHEVINYCFDPNNGIMIENHCELLTNEEIQKSKKIYESMKESYPDAKIYLSLYIPVNVEVDTKKSILIMKWKPCIDFV